MTGQKQQLQQQPKYLQQILLSKHALMIYHINFDPIRWIASPDSNLWFCLPSKKTHIALIIDHARFSTTITKSVNNKSHDLRH